MLDPNMIVAVPSNLTNSMESGLTISVSIMSVTLVTMFRTDACHKKHINSCSALIQLLMMNIKIYVSKDNNKILCRNY